MNYWTRPIENLVRHILGLEELQRRMREWLDEKNRQIAKLEESARPRLQANHDRLQGLADKVTGCAYGKMSAEMVLEARLPAGDLMAFPPGRSIVISGADASDFSQLERELLHGRGMVNVTIGRKDLAQIFETLERLDAAAQYGPVTDEVAFGHTAADFLAGIVGYERAV